jgi:hypothetical protein
LSKIILWLVILSSPLFAQTGEKISALPNGVPAQPGDQIPVARNGSNYSITAGSVAALSSGLGILNFFGNIPGNTLSQFVDPTTMTDAAGNTIKFAVNEFSWSDASGDSCFGQTGTLKCFDGNGDYISVSDGVIKIQTVSGPIFEITGSSYFINDGTATTVRSTGGNLFLTNILPGVIYSATGTPLPSCASGINGEQAVVSDATSPTYMSTYTSGGGITAAVICSYNGTTYSWLTH